MQVLRMAVLGALGVSFAALVVWTVLLVAAAIVAVRRARRPDPLAAELDGFLEGLLGRNPSPGELRAQRP